ncbi:hypothetical protein GGR53DRAFT_109616 [Hypoxylon sp. FL1150]|nr:hypothetical protein GGR53DRAFT_109616 [Hypoxylon sp. FL1150]
MWAIGNALGIFIFATLEGCVVFRLFSGKYRVINPRKLHNGPIRLRDRALSLSLGARILIVHVGIYVYLDVSVWVPGSQARQVKKMERDINELW